MEQLRVACGLQPSGAARRVSGCWSGSGGGIRWPTAWLTSERAFRWSAEGPLATRQTRKHPPQDPLR